VNSSTSSSRRFALGFLAVFVGTVLAFVAGSEAIVRHVGGADDGFGGYKAKLREARAPVAAFGDSQVAEAIETGPAIVGLGYAGDTLPLTIEKVRAIVAAKRAERVVIQFSPQQFANYRIDDQQKELADELLGRSEPWLSFTRPQFRRYLLEYWRALLSNPMRFFAHNTAQAETMPAAPPVFTDKPADEQRRSAEIRVQLHMPLPLGADVDRQLARLTGLLDELARQSIPACVAEFPVSAAYRSAAARAPSFAALRAELQRRVEARGVRFVDLSAQVTDRYFSDADHIGPQGRALVTRLVLDECFGEPRARRVS
jgi:hypothetical protein